MIRHGETAVITHVRGGRPVGEDGLIDLSAPPVASGFTTTPEYRIAYFAEAARLHPLAKRSAFRRRVWRDDQSLGDRIHASSAARRLSAVTDAQLDQVLADLRDGVTP